ncbi:hypothetical protein F934_01258 [Acinetobacter beijerinckii ANC 3835]|uniref:Uncharacterized protein n=1 Tax=Acinetobacter beijerinckii ANC 3835 TaxID=1217649 RepID=N9E478_9GAMM|nr:hypothetical protein F934_01258 [Acinetobacter beijerinckii ANC 3835]
MSIRGKNRSTTQVCSHLQIAYSARDQLKLNLSIIRSPLNCSYAGYSNPTFDVG